MRGQTALINEGTDERMDGKLDMDGWIQRQGGYKKVYAGSHGFCEVNPEMKIKSCQTVPRHSCDLETIRIHEKIKYMIIRPFHYGWCSGVQS